MGYGLLGGVEMIGNEPFCVMDQSLLISLGKCVSRWYKSMITDALTRIGMNRVDCQVLKGKAFDAPRLQHRNQIF